MSKATAREVIAEELGSMFAFDNSPDIGGANSIIDALRAAGLVVVPVEPTEAMYLATCDAWEYHGSGFDQFKREYQAMIAASQEDKG